MVACKGAADYRLPHVLWKSEAAIQRCFFNISVPKNYKMFLRNIHRNISVLGSLFNKVAGLQTCSFLKKRLQHRNSPVNIEKFLRTPYLLNTSGGCFWTVKVKRLENLLEHIYTIKNLFSFSSGVLRDGYALPILIEAQLLRLLASIPLQVQLSWTYGRSNSLYHIRWERTLPV